MGRKIPKHKKQKSLLNGISKNERAKRDEEDQNNSLFLVSFKDLDREQGQSLTDWEQQGILARAIETIRGYCCSPLVSQGDEKFTIYGNFPPKDKTQFTFPRHISEDAKWARIHVTGEQCLIGHVIKNVFYVVFLDKEHEFWKSELKHT